MSTFGRAESISIEKLEGAVRAAAGTHKHLFEGDQRPGWWKDPGIVGLVVRETDLGKVDFKEVDAAARSIAKAAGFAAEPATLILDKRIIAGFFPVEKFHTFTR